MNRGTILLIFGILILVAMQFYRTYTATSDKPPKQLEQPISVSDLSADNKQSKQAPTNLEEDPLELISQQVKLGFWNQVTDLINTHYSSLSQSQLDLLQDKILTSIAKESTEARLQVLISLNSTFATNKFSIALAEEAIKQQQWRLALDTLLTLSQGQTQLDGLADTMKQLQFASLKLKSQHLESQDWLSIKTLYEELLVWHPQRIRFQYEYALSLMHVDQLAQAKPIFESLIYHPEYGDATRTMLKQINDKEGTLDKGVIEIPLISKGTSSFVLVSINDEPTELLLDTGASITGLASRVINNLGLYANNKKIWLDTANGRAQTTLWIASSLRIGPLEIKNLPIASLNMGSGGVNGLLGTDVLSAFDDDYTFIIDRKKNVLEFRPLTK